MPPASAAQGMSTYPDGGYGVSLLLGSDYERRKSKLQQELQQDYKQFVAKKKVPKYSEPHPEPFGLSLPLRDRTLVQEKLREERKKEYKLFIEKQSQNRRLRTDVPPVPKEPGNIQASNAAPSVPPPPVCDTLMNDPPPWKRPASRRDVATLTETLDDGERTKSRVQGYRSRRRWIIRPKEQHSSEEEVNSDREEELEFQHRRRHVRYTPEPEHREREARELRATRATRAQHSKEEEASEVYDQNNNSVIKESDLQMPDRMRTPARSRPATRQEKAELATGLMIGATEEQTASQRRKEQYKQELLKQIAEQKRNKIREKKLELRVAATGAKDPEKESDRLNPYGAVRQPLTGLKHDASPKPRKGREVSAKELKDKPRDDNTADDAKRNIPLEKPIVDSNTSRPVRWIAVPGTGAAQQVPSLNYYSDGYHRNPSDMFGEVAWQRVAAIPPAPPPVTYHNMAPYDAPYYYYGTRNPLHPNLPYWQQPGNFPSPSQPPPPQTPSGYTEPPDHQRASRQKVGESPEEKPEQRRRSSLSYHEELRQQIKEKEEHKRREKEEKEKEAEVPVYNPWGKSGGGAPIKDQNGNLVSDLNQMHRTNEESYRNPELRNHGHKQRVMTGDVPPLLPGLNKETYKEELTKQVEEKKREKEEEKERLRLIMEKEEKRLEDQRARMRQQYEEDRRKEEMKRKRHEDHSWVNEQKTQHRMEGKEGRQEKDVEKTPESIRDKEEKQKAWSYNNKEKEECHRREKEEGSYRVKKEVRLTAYNSPGCEDEASLSHQLPGHKKKTFKEELPEQRLQSRPIPTLQKKQTNPVASRPSSVMRHLSSKTRRQSPPIPTLQKKQTNTVASRSSSVMSQLSSKTERSVSTPSCSEVPAQAQDRQQEVLRELSNLRRYLKKKQRQQEEQLDWTNSLDSDYVSPSRSRGHPRAAAFELSHQQRVQPTIRSPSSGAAHANSQNIREFNQLKYRDTASREEVRLMYPDPPTDAQSLDIQQQALLREQQRKIRLMKKDKEHDFLDQELNNYHSENKPGRHRDSVLPSQSAFINVYGDSGSEGQRKPRPSAENRERTTARRRHDYDEVVESMDKRNCLPFLNPGSEVKPNDQPHAQRQKTADQTTRSGWPSGDEADVLSLRSALERPVSVDTVATEPWLRPGTSDAVKQSGFREKPNNRVDTPSWLAHQVT